MRSGTVARRHGGKENRADIPARAVHALPKHSSTCHLVMISGPMKVVGSQVESTGM